MMLVQAKYTQAGGTMDTPVTILGIPGSLRRGSYNRAALRVAQQLVPAGARLEVAEIGELPAYNQDIETTPPAAVSEFKRRIRGADAVLFATPEYNYSVPGVLKNAIDWASRPYGDSAWDGKPAAIMGASGGPVATARAQYHLRQILVYLNMPALIQPEVLIGSAQEKFDQNGNLIHDPTRERIRQMLEALVRWTLMLRREPPD
jgi:chromate reductase